MDLNIDWTTLKGVASSKTLPLQYVDFNASYYVFAVDGALGLSCLIPKDSGADQSDFEANFKATANKDLVNRDPIFGREITMISAFSANIDFTVKATGFSGSATLGVTTNLDFAVGSSDRYINGIQLLVKNHAWGDTVGLQVVDKDNVLGYGAGVVLNRFGATWNINNEKQDQGAILFNYASRLPAGVYLRIVYVSTGLVNVDVKFNVFLHQKV